MSMDDFANKFGTPVPPIRIGPLEQIAERPSLSIGQPPPATVLLAIVKEMATLAKRPKIAGTAIGGVVIGMRLPG